jgi:hypothetical protein
MISCGVWLSHVTSSRIHKMIAIAFHFMCRILDTRYWGPYFLLWEQPLSAISRVIPLSHCLASLFHGRRRLLATISCFVSGSCVIILCMKGYLSLVISHTTRITHHLRTVPSYIPHSKDGTKLR